MRTCRDRPGKCEADDGSVQDSVAEFHLSWVLVTAICSHSREDVRLSTKSFGSGTMYKREFLGESHKRNTVMPAPRDDTQST